jgi:hypothetical protein
MADAAELARMLASRMATLAPELLPGGRREGAEWVVADLTGRPGRSLSVRITGPKAGVWQDFATGEGGDALALIAAAHCRGDMRQAMAWARAWLGLGHDAPRTTPAERRAADERREAEAAREAEARRRAAVALFLDAREGIVGTPAGDYLIGRGIDLAALGRQPRCLRFHPSAWCAEVGTRLPALLAAITDADGRHVATHRTWLARDASGAWGKAPLRDPKKTLGSYAGGCIRLWRGATGRSLSDAQPGEAVAIAEGIETGLSVAVACPELRVLAAVSLANMGRLILPPQITTVTLCADDDGDNQAAAELLIRAAERFAREGRAVRIARPPQGHKDMNDALTGKKAAP